MCILGPETNWRDSMKKKERCGDITPAQLFFALSKECEKAEKYGDISFSLLDAALRKVMVVEHHVYMNSRNRHTYKAGCNFLLCVLKKFSSKSCAVEDLLKRMEHEIGILVNIRFLLFPPKSDYIEASEFCKALALYFKVAVNRKTNLPHTCLTFKDAQ